MTDGIRGLVPGVDDPRADPATPRLRAFHWTHLLNGAANEIVTVVVIDTAANEVLAVLNRHGGPLDPATEADVRQSLRDNAELYGGAAATCWPTCDGDRCPPRSRPWRVPIRPTPPK